MRDGGNILVDVLPRLVILLEPHPTVTHSTIRPDAPRVPDDLLEVPTSRVHSGDIFRWDKVATFVMVSFAIATKEGYDTSSHQRRRSSRRGLGEEVMTRLEFCG